jgi:hypothetical protein
VNETVLIDPNRDNLRGRVLLTAWFHVTIVGPRTVRVAIPAGLARERADLAGQVDEAGRPNVHLELADQHQLPSTVV